MRIRAATCLLWVALTGCVAEGDTAPTGAVEVRVTTQALAGIGDACFDIDVRSASVVTSSARRVCTSDYGIDNAISWVGICQPGSAPAVVELVLAELFDEDGLSMPPAAYDNPCPPGRPCAQSVTCLQNADARAEFNIELFRRLTTGFADVSVNLDEIRCAARVSCELGGEPILLPYAGTEGAYETMLLEVECVTTSAQRAPTNLLWNDLIVDCGGRSYSYPGWDAGGTYFADEPLQTLRLDAGYSPEASPLLLAGLRAQLALNRRVAQGCRLVFTATAWPGAIGDPSIPFGVDWPIITFDTPIAPEDQRVACGSFTLDDGSGVITASRQRGPWPFDALFNGTGIVKP